MYYTVYKVTNIVNFKFYIGVHKTLNPNDSYMGSGRAIKAAIKKYGKENFVKEILYLTESKVSAYNKERELTAQFYKADNYNMKLGGVGGFTRENSIKGYENYLAKMSSEDRSRNGKIGYKNGLAKLDMSQVGRKGGLSNKGKPKSPEHIAKIKAAWERKKPGR